MPELAINGGPKLHTKPWPSWPVWDEREIRALEEVVRSGRWGRLHEHSKVAQFEEVFAAYQDARFGVAVTSGTAALVAGLQAVGVDVGDEVIVPAYTFIATASAVLELKAVPVFVDVELDTINIDPEAVEAAITPRTRAVVPVHWAGRAVDLDRILDIARRHSLAVVEDACHCWGSTWNDRKLGAIGDLGGISFQESKHITAGEGGMVLTNHEELAAKVFSYHHIGRLPDRPFYEHHSVGTNYRMTEFQAAVLLAQFERLEEQTQRREENGAFLDEQFAQIAGLRCLRREPYMTRISRHGYNLLYHPEAYDGLPRDRFLQALNAEGIPASAGYAHPLYANPVFAEARFGRIKQFVEFPDYAAVSCPNAERICRERIGLSQVCLLADRDEVRDILRAVEKIIANLDELR